MPIDALPAAPSRTNSPADFSTKADALLGALPGFVTQTNALAADLTAKKDAFDTAYSQAQAAGLAQAATNAGVATTKAAEAVSAAGQAASAQGAAGISQVQAALSAAAAAAIVLGVASNRPSIRPSLLLDFANTKQLDPRITFSRASAASYYDGSTTYAGGVNLFTYSQQFDNAAWSKSSVTVTADAAAAPDGTSTADAIITTAATAIMVITGGSATGTCTFSVFAKANGYNYLQMYGSGNSDYANFNLSNGTISQSSGGSPVITPVGNGWYRCQITSAGLATCYLAPKIAGTELRHASITGNGTSGIYLWGAQLEPYSTISGYTPTTSAAINAPVYVPKIVTAAANVARFDHNPVTGESLGLLVEEQRTNIIVGSATFNAGGWTPDGAFLFPNANIAPDGTLSASTIALGSGNNRIYHFDNSGVTGSKVLTIYAKAGAGSSLTIRVVGGMTPAGDTSFNLATQVVSGANSSATMTAVGGGWYRLNLPVSVSVASGSSTYFCLVNTGQSVSIWGAQLEAGAFPSSYIPTTSAQVTRSADNATISTANMPWFRRDEGTLYAEATTRMSYDTGAGPVAVVAGFGDAVNNRFEALGRIDTSTRVYEAYGYWRDAIDTYDAYEGANYTFSPNTQIKAAVAMKAGDYATSFNGAAVMATSAINRLINARLNIGSDWAGASMNGTIKRLAYYPARLSNSELQGLTA